MLARNARVDWHPTDGRRGAVRRVAREQHRLGDLARPVLGHAAAGVGVRRRRGARRVRRRLRRTGRARRRAAAARLRSAQAARRRLHVAVPRDWLRGHDASRARGDRHLVRLGVDVVRAVALSVRESRQGRRAVPGGLHRRGRRPDARLVLLAARDRHRAWRRAAEQRDGAYGASPYRARRRQRHGARRRTGSRCRRAAATSSIRGR